MDHKKWKTLSKQKKEEEKYIVSEMKDDVRENSRGRRWSGGWTNHHYRRRACSSIDFINGD